MEGRAPTLDDRMLRAIAHPLRFRVLVALDEEVASPKQVAQKLGEPLGRVSHHVRLLARLGAIELVSTRPRRGATEHFYRTVTRPWFDDDAWARLPVSARRTLVGDTLGRIATDIGSAVDAGGFDDLRTYVSRVHLRLDDDARGEVTRILDDAVDRIIRLQEAGTSRASRPPAVPTELVILHFERG